MLIFIICDKNRLNQMSIQYQYLGILVLFNSIYYSLPLNKLTNYITLFDLSVLKPFKRANQKSWFPNEWESAK